MNVGVDIVSCQSIARFIESYGNRFKERVYTRGEIEYCDSFHNAIERYAGRWAAKEAVSKALGTGMSQGVTWKNIEVISERCGKPTIELSGIASTVMQNANAIDVQVSISHCDNTCIAFAVLVKETESQTQIQLQLLAEATLVVANRELRQQQLPSPMIFESHLN